MSQPYSILYLDDEVDNLTAFKAVFRRFYNIYIAENADIAQEILAQQSVDLIVCDQRMPGKTGVEFLEEISRTHPDVIRMILTGYSDMQAIIDAINKGKVYHYITKPWKFEELKVIFDNALETYTLRQKNILLESEKKELLLQKAQQEKQHITSQYEVLKNQINPHFLFNSLNTLASIIATDQDSAIKFTTKFAKMYRSILEHGEQKLIPLERELDLIENFIYLQKTRFGDQLKLKLEIKDKAYALPPFSLQLLVENAIKHNIISATQPMEILITQEGEKLVISNAIVPRVSTETSTGIGLKNLASRYQLLIQKDIAISQDKDVFKVILPLIPDA